MTTDATLSNDHEQVEMYQYEPFRNARKQIRLISFEDENSRTTFAVAVKFSSSMQHPPITQYHTLGVKHH